MNEAKAHKSAGAMGRWMLWGLVAAVLGAWLVWSFIPEPIAVDVQTVERGALEVHIRAEGRTRVRDIYTLSAPVSGRLVRVGAQPGDEVRAGETQLAVIEPADPTILDKRSLAEARAQVQAAEDALALAAAEMDRAQAELTFAKAELERAQRLRENETISQRALDLALLEMATREAALKSAQATAKVRAHELETARARLITPADTFEDGECCVKVTAPVDGKVLRVMTKSAGVVTAGTPLMDVGDPRRLEVVVDLLTQDAARVDVDAPVAITNWGGAPLNGRVRRVEPFGYTKVSVLGVEEQRIDVVVAFDEAALPASLSHGFRVDAAILTWQGEDVLRVPMAALFRSGGEWAVFVLEDGRAVLKPLQIGRMNDNAAQVLGGLDEGERVVLHPGDRVHDGARLSLRKP